VDIVRYLINEQGCSIACQNKYGDTPLLEACREGHLAVVEMLLTTQDCSTTYNKHGRILLHYSISVNCMSQSTCLDAHLPFWPKMKIYVVLKGNERHNSYQ